MTVVTAHQALENQLVILRFIAIYYRLAGQVCQRPPQSKCVAVVLTQQLCLMTSFEAKMLVEGISGGQFHIRSLAKPGARHIGRPKETRTLFASKSKFLLRETAVANDLGGS